MGTSDEQFCLKWNDFQQSITSTFQDLRDDADFLDVTVCCDGQQVKAHKVILSACSVTFRQLLKMNPATHPVIVLWEVSPRDLAAVMDFMYHGEVNVKQDNLNSFLSVAERLQVRGLCEKDNSSMNARSEVRSVEVKDRVRAEPERKKARLSPARTQEETVAVKQEMTEERETTNGRTEPAPTTPVRPDYGGENRPDRPDYRTETRPDYRTDTRPDYRPDMSLAVNEYEDYGGYDEDMANYGMCESDSQMMGDIAPGDQSASKGSVRCPYCEKVLKYRHNLKGHIQNQHGDGEPEAPCPICPDKVFKNAASLRDHMSRKHRPEKHVATTNIIPQYYQGQ